MTQTCGQCGASVSRVYFDLTLPRCVLLPCGHAAVLIFGVK